VSRIRPHVALGLLALAAAGLSGSAVWYAARGSGDSTPTCGRPIPRGSSGPAAWDTASLFISEVVLLHDPVCGYALSTRRLRGGLSSREWARGTLPITPFVTRYPPTPVERASPNPDAPQAVYALSRRFRELLRRDAEGKWTIPLAVGLAAPDAGMGAYRLVLALEDGNWRVDRAAPVELTQTDSG
jgi:hypothetical protein